MKKRILRITSLLLCGSMLLTPAVYPSISGAPLGTAGQGSFAAGQESLTAGQKSFAAGQKSFAAGQGSFAAGQKSFAAGQGSFAAGQKSFAAASDTSPAASESTSNLSSPEDTLKIDVIPVSAPRTTKSKTISTHKTDTRLLDLLDNGSTNTVISPLSLNMALAMAGNGAKGKTKKEIEAYLGETIASYNKKAKKYRKIEGLSVANSLWATNDKSYMLKETFTDKLSTYYGARTRNVDFSSAETVKQINSWVNKKTNGMIPSLADEFDKDTKAALINAIYFDFKWSDPFDPSGTYKKKFKNSDGSTSKVRFMNGSAEYYMSNSKAVAFAKSYTNSRFEFIAILPKTEGDFNTSDLNLRSLLKSRTTKYKVNVSMPKFDFSYKADNLEDTLTSFGIKTAFSDKADLSGMSKKSLYLDSVMQKARVTVDEEGTKAAAVTGIFAKATAFMNQKYKTISLNRPFVFAIYDKQQDEILFIGKVSQL